MRTYLVVDVHVKFGEYPYTDELFSSLFRRILVTNLGDVINGSFVLDTPQID